MGIIYKVTNRVNNKIYIGQTVQKWPLRKIQHENKPAKYSIIDRAIQKYGKDNFEWEIVAMTDDQDFLNYLEIFYINLFDSNIKKHGYNLRNGGNSGGSHSKSSRLKMSKARLGVEPWNKGKKMTNEYGLKVSKGMNNNPLSKRAGKLHHFYGKKRSESDKKKISKAVSITMQKKEYPGASLEKNKNPELRCWRSEIQYRNRSKRLGLYEDPLSASIVYKLVWTELYGDNPIWD